jgi:hypothetical protein
LHPVSLEVIEETCPKCSPHGTALHAQVHLHHRTRGWSGCVDAGIAPLIAELWAAGIQTSYSCERMEQDRAQVLFPSARDVSSLLEVLRRNEHQGMALRICSSVVDGWDFDVATPLSVMGHEGDDLPGDTRLRINALIPLEDVITVTALFAATRGGDAYAFPTERPGSISREGGPQHMAIEVYDAISAVESARRELVVALKRHHPEWL